MLTARLPRLTTPILGAVGALMLSSCSSSARLERMETRLAEIQRQVQQLQDDAPSRDDLEQLQGSVAQDTDKVLRSEADLKADVQQLALRIGELDARLQDTVYRIEQLSQQVAATNQELKSLIASVPPSRRGEGAPVEDLPASDPETLYQEAYADYRRSNYDLAILGFREYLETYPETELADNALYWLGESHFAQGSFDRAIEQFSEVLSRYPRSEKVASAMLKRGYAFLELGRRDQGLQELRSLLQTHPSSEEAAIARQQLEQLESGS